MQRATSGKLLRCQSLRSLPCRVRSWRRSLTRAGVRHARHGVKRILTTAFARVGFSGDYGGTYFMTQLVGSAKARELYYLSDRVSADEALQLGLANWVVEPEALMDKTMEIAKGWPSAQRLPTDT